MMLDPISIRNNIESLPIGQEITNETASLVTEKPLKLVKLSLNANLASSIVLGTLLGNRLLHLVDHKLPLSLQTSINTIRGLVTDQFALVGCLFLWFIDMVRFDPKEVTKSNNINRDIPILLIHGYMHNSSGWWYTRYRLNNAGFKNIYSINLGFPSLKSIEEYSNKVDTKVREILSKHSSHTGNQIRMVGHSMGGVIATHYTLTRASNVDVINVTTLGAPLEGTHTAKITPGKCAAEVSYNSIFMKQFTPKVREYNGKTRFCHIGSEADLIIRPTSSAILSKTNADNTLMLPDIGHLTYLFYDLVMEAIIKQANYKQS